MDDLLYSFTEWLRTTQLVELAEAISGTGPNQWMVTNFWAIPLVQTAHILAIASGFGALLMMTLRIQGWAGAGMTVAETTRRYLPWIRWALLVLIASGLLLIIGEPSRELINPIFWIKMLLVAATFLISIFYHKRVLRRVESGREIGASAKAGSLLLIVLWCVIMLCGRWIAYAPI